MHKVMLESTSERCHHRVARAVGEKFEATEREAVVLVGLKRARRFIPDVEQPTPAATSAPARKQRTARDPNAPRRAYKRRDMRAEG